MRCDRIFFDWTQAKAIRLDGARTLQASITQQSTGFLATKAAALRVNQQEHYKECQSTCELAAAHGKTSTAPL
jgi:hypothetical protein